MELIFIMPDDVLADIPLRLGYDYRHSQDIAEPILTRDE
jgi:hypothetical protein